MTQAADARGGSTHPGSSDYPFTCGNTGVVSPCGYEWLDVGLAFLHGIEPHEVIQVLGARRRWLRPAVGPDGHRVMTIWGTHQPGACPDRGRAPARPWDWQILGARDLDAEEMSEFKAWEDP